MENHRRLIFLVLIIFQAAHSVEEYVFALYDVFAPAQAISRLVSANIELGFVIVNTTIVLLGFWCYFARVRSGRPSATGWMWAWVVLELGNGFGHVAVAMARGAYFPGLITAPFLFVLAALLARQLLRVSRLSDVTDS